MFVYLTCTIGEGRESISADSFVVTITTKIKSRERPTRKYELKERERERKKGQARLLYGFKKTN